MKAPNNWKTTLAGFIAATLNFYATGMTAKAAIASAGIAVVGTLAKDSDVTGGTREAK